MKPAEARAVNNPPSDEEPTRDKVTRASATAEGHLEGWVGIAATAAIMGTIEKGPPLSATAPTKFFNYSLST